MAVLRSDTTIGGKRPLLEGSPVPVASGGTGATSLTSGAALIGNGTGAVTTRSITNNTSTSSSISGSTNLPTMNTLRYALNRTTSVASADASYTTTMARGISLQTSTPSSVANGALVVTYS